MWIIESLHQFHSIFHDLTGFVVSGMFSKGEERRFKYFFSVLFSVMVKTSKV